MKAGRHPLSFEQLTVINSHEDHLNAVEYLAKSHRPCVVLAGSGMCAGGRVVNYLKAMLDDARTTYCSSATRPPERRAETFSPMALVVAGWSWMANATPSALRCIRWAAIRLMRGRVIYCGLWKAFPKHPNRFV